MIVHEKFLTILLIVFPLKYEALSIKFSHFPSRMVLASIFCFSKVLCDTENLRKTVKISLIVDDNMPRRQGKLSHSAFSVINLREILPNVREIHDEGVELKAIQREY